MNKKNYQKPTVRIVQLQQRSALLVESNNPPGYTGYAPSLTGDKDVIA